MTTNYQVALDAARSGQTAVIGNWDRSVPTPSSRVYFYDADTGEELYGAIDVGCLEAGIWKGQRYMNTRLGVSVVDLNTRMQGFVCADAFPGRRVEVRTWLPEGHSMKPERFFLVDRARGWQGNEADDGKIGRTLLKK